MRSKRGFHPQIRSLKLLVSLAILLCFWTEDAHAYLNPATGSMILQVVLAVLIGIGVAIKKLRLKIWSFFQYLARKILGQDIEHD